jgi:Tfp pilus assembly protein PilO
MKHLPKEKRDRLIMVTVVTIACLAGIWYGLIANQRKSIDRLAKDIAEQKMKVANAERLVATAPELKKNQELLQARLQTIEEGMASGDMYSWIIQTMRKFCAGRNVEIPQFSREVPGEVGILPRFPYKAATFTLRGSAYFHDLGQFIADFENSFPYIRVQNLELDSGASSAANATTTSTTQPTDGEKLSFKMEVVALVNPNAH